MEIGKPFGRLGAQIRELLSKLTTSQKITIGLLSVLLGASVVVLVRSTVGTPYVRLAGTADAKSAGALRGILDGNGIPYRIVADNGGAIEVPRDKAAHARWLAAEAGVADAKDTNLEWLWGEGSLLDTEKRIDTRLLESRRKTVEDAIRWSRSIRDVRIVIQQGPAPIYANRTGNSDTAAVAVALRPGVETLSRPEAAAIRTLVAGAFAIPPQNIKVADDRLRDYAYADGSGAGLSEEEDRTRRTVLSTVENLLGRIYRPSEFVVGVLVDLSSHRSQRTSLTYAPEGVSIEKSSVKETETTVRGPSSPVGVDPNVSGGIGSAAPVPAIDRTSRDRRETTNETHVSHVEEKVEVPAGEVKGLSVNVVLDRAAVRRVLQAEEWLRMTPDEQKGITESAVVDFTVNGKREKNNIDQAVEAHRKAQSVFLLDQIPMSGAKVNVSAVVFPKPELPVETAPSTFVWASEHWSEILLGGVALFGLIVVWGMFRRSVPPPIDIPPLDESVLDEESKAGDDEIRTLEERLAAANPVPAMAVAGKKAEEGEEERDPMVQTVEDVKALTRDNPEMASAVIRMWMNGRDGDA